jgi:hypothetical protein
MQHALQSQVLLYREAASYVLCGYNICSPSLALQRIQVVMLKHSSTVFNTGRIWSHKSACKIVRAALHLQIRRTLVSSLLGTYRTFPAKI